MSQYIVIAPDGKRFGPTDFQTLSQWALDGRVMPGMMVEDVLSQQTTVASAVPGLNFGQASYTEYPRNAQIPVQGKEGTGTAALVVGLFGLIGWCIPFIGFPVGIAAVVLGIKGLKTLGRPKAVAGLTLGAICIVLSTINAILGAMLVMNGFLN